MSPPEFLSAKMALAGQFEFRETSGYRSALDNATLGGVPHSAHRFWLGADVILRASADTKEFLEAARRLGLFALDEGDHIHLQPLTWEKG